MYTLKNKTDLVTVERSPWYLHQRSWKNASICSTRNNVYCIPNKCLPISSKYAFTKNWCKYIYILLSVLPRHLLAGAKEREREKTMYNDNTMTIITMTIDDRWYMFLTALAASHGGSNRGQLYIYIHRYINIFMRRKQKMKKDHRVK